jgi:glycosyltransferase involved in cell wall biosynthesis
MHIAWLGKKSPFCGNVTYSREVTNALLDRKNRVSFLHFATEESEKEDFPESSEVLLPFIYKSQIYTIPSFHSSKVLMRSLKEIQPDLVHASLTLSPLDFLLPEICQELNLPLVATFHPAFDGNKLRNLQASTQFFTYQLYAPFLAHYDRVIVFSHIQRDLLLKMGVKPEQLVIIPNGVDTGKYSPDVSDLKQQYKAKHLFIYQGRISVEKNLEALLRAWKYCNLGADCKLLIVGNGPLTSSLQPSYSKLDNIIWLGFVGDEQERIKLLRGSDVFILPSLVEGLSLSLLEAMSCGIACVATNAGADGEVLEGGAGIVLNTTSVATQLKTLLPVLRDQPEFTHSLGEKARQRVLERYTLEDNITKLEVLYQDVLTTKQYNFSHLKPS